MDLLKKYYPYATGVFVLIIYLFTLAPSVIQIDSGELAAVQWLPGIAHPTGYPLFTILGYLFLHIPSPFTHVFMSNLLAALWCASAAAIFTASAKLILDNITSFHSTGKSLPAKNIKKGKGKEKEKENVNRVYTISEEFKISASIAGGMILAFSKTFWFQSTSVEVYSLHLLLANIIIFFLLKAYLGSDKKSWIVFALMLALGFTNHMTTLLILPAAAYLYFNKFRFTKESFKFICVMLLFFFPVLILVYSYLPINASNNPAVNWGNPINSDNFIRHISGKQYQVWLFSSTAAAKKQFAYFFQNLPSEFVISGLILSIIGLFSTIYHARKLFIFIVLLFLSTLFYSINYDIVDIDSYFLLAYIALSFFAVFGVIKLTEFLITHKFSFAAAVSVIGVLIILQVFINYSKVSQSGVHTFEDYTKALITSTPKNSIIFSYQWDYFVSASYYFQQVEGLRKDAAVIDKELLRRSWYFNQLKTNYPGIYNRIQPEINSFVNALKPFEHDQQYNSDLLERLYRNLMAQLVAKNIADHPFYIAPELVENEMEKGEFNLPEGFHLVPDLFLFKVVKTTEYVKAGNPDFKIRFPEKRNYYINFIENTIGAMLVRRILYEIKFDKMDRARVYINKIKTDLPNYQIPYELRDVLK